MNLENNDKPFNLPLSHFKIKSLSFKVGTLWSSQQLFCPPSPTHLPLRPIHTETLNLQNLQMQLTSRMTEMERCETANNPQFWRRLHDVCPQTTCDAKINNAKGCKLRDVCGFESLHLTQPWCQLLLPPKHFKLGNRLKQIWTVVMARVILDWTIPAQEVLTADHHHRAPTISLQFARRSCGSDHPQSLKLGEKEDRENCPCNYAKGFLMAQGSFWSK